MSGFIGAIIIGIAAGFLAGKIMKSDASNIMLNLIVGVIGGVIGKVGFGLLGIGATNIIGSLVTSTAGAIVLLWLVAYFKKK